MTRLALELSLTLGQTQSAGSVPTPIVLIAPILALVSGTSLTCELDAGALEGDVLTFTNGTISIDYVLSAEDESDDTASFDWAALPGGTHDVSVRHERRSGLTVTHRSAFSNEVEVTAVGADSSLPILMVMEMV